VTAPGRAQRVIDADTLVCKSARSHVCTSDGCVAQKPSSWLEIDQPEGLYKRCDAKGCDAYAADITMSGAFLVVGLIGRPTMMKVSGLDGTFVDVATMGTAAVLNFGSCR
jgi:hypothetical protein